MCNEYDIETEEAWDRAYDKALEKHIRDQWELLNSVSEEAVTRFKPGDKVKIAGIIAPDKQFLVIEHKDKDWVTVQNGSDTVELPFIWLELLDGPSLGCKHEWTVYDSGWNRYEYCTKCDSKKQ